MTIDGSINVATGSKITVDSGGSLILNGALNAAESMNEIYMEVYQTPFLSHTLTVSWIQDYANQYGTRVLQFNGCSSRSNGDKPELTEKIILTSM